jgi:tetratricopeptide (TPR) repeat protein
MRLVLAACAVLACTAGIDSAAGRAPSPAVSPGSVPRVAGAPQTVPAYDLDVRIAHDGVTVDGTMLLPGPPAGGIVSLTCADVVSAFSASAAGTDGVMRDLPVDAGPASAGTRTYRGHLDAGAGGAGATTLRLHWRDDPGKHFVYSVRDGFTLMEGDDTAWYPQLAGAPRGIGTLRFHVAPGIVVAASGTRADGGADPELFAFTVREPTHFAVVAAAFTTYESPGSPPIREYSTRPRAEAATYLASARRTMSVLQRMYGPAPYGTFAIVDIPDADASGFSGASAAGMILVTSSFLNAPYNTAYFGHEMSHQWWGNAVEISDGLDEVLAQYSSLQVVDALEGPAAAERYRRTGYPGYVEDQCARGYFAFAAGGEDVPVARLDDGVSAHDIGDSKGFLVVDLLARETGRARFTADLRAYATAHLFAGEAPNRDLLAAAGSHGPVDFPRFWREWFLRTGAPSFTVISSRHGDEIEGRILQLGDVYHVALPLAVARASGPAVTETIATTGRSTAFRFRVPHARGVVLDPAYEVLRHTALFDEEAAATAHVLRGAHFMSARKNDEAAAELRAALAQPPMPHDEGVRFRAHYLLGVLSERRGDWTSARDLLAAAVRDAHPTAQWVPYAYLALVRADVALGDTPAAERDAGAARRADAALGGTAGIEDALVQALRATPAPSPSSSPMPGS